jgi:GntR family carbon starvation induced transcriptional regulator
LSVSVVPANPLPRLLTQVDQVVLALSADIIACRLMPDAKLHIALLAEQLGVSLGAVREALAALAAQGLVVAQPQRGYRVSPISGMSLSHLVQARVEIECLCLREAVKHGDLQWEVRCLTAHAALHRAQSQGAADGGDAQSMRLRAHDEFHLALVSGCPNEWLLRIQRNLYQQSERYRCLT